MHLKSFYWVFVERFGSIVVKFGFMMLLARLLTPADFGNVAIVSYIVATLTVLIDSGLGGSLVRKKIVNDVDYTTIHFFTLGMSIFIFIVFVVASPYISDYYQNQSLQKISYILGGCLVFRALTVVQVAHLTKKFRFRSQALCNLIATVIAGVLAVVMAVNHFGYWALVVQQIVEAMVLYLLYRNLNKDISFGARFSFSVLKEHFSFGSKLALSSFLESGGTNIVVNVITKKGGVVLTGSYSQVSRINDIFIGVMTTTIDKAAFPILVSLEPERFTPYLTKLLAYVLIILYFFIGLIFIVSKDIIRIALGLQWVQYDWILQIIMLCGFGQLIEVVMRSALKAQGKSNLILKLAIFKFICLVVFLVLLSIQGGVKEILLATLFSSIMSALAFLSVVSASTNIKKIEFFKQIYPPIISIVGALLVVYQWQDKINNLIRWIGFVDLNSIYYSFFKISIDSVVLLIVYVGILVFVANGHSRELIYELGMKIRAKL